MRPGIKEFDIFIRGPFVKEIREAYEDLTIFCEADLQALAWDLIREFLTKFPEAKTRVLNKPYFKDVKIHPDLAVFRNEKPWVVLELKERTEMTVPSALRERDRMLRLRQRMKYPRGKYPKRGYLVYLAHYGKDRLLPGRKKDGARFFFEVPIVLETHWTPKRIEEWEGKFRVWSKFACRQKPKPKSK